MSLMSAIGLSSSAKKVRYAVVGLGDIAQEAMLPGIAHTGNSELAAFVTDDPVKARALGELYGVTHSFAYAQFGELLRAGLVDAIYLATPNWRHAEFIMPALAAGVHVLVEKPLEITAEKCREIMAAQKSSAAKLMVAYRLHFEPGTLAAIDKVRSGELGDVMLFSSAFTQRVDPANHRAKNGDLAGPVLDMGPYPVNASRYIFGDEPTEVVSATGSRHPDAGFGDFDDTVAVTLRFPGGRLAQFVLSYAANTVDSYHVIGSKGSLHVSPGFMFGKSLEHQVTIGEKQSHQSFRNTDHFGGEMKYFSDCILQGLDPEPDAEEGFADMRVLEGILEALKSGKPVTLAPFTRSRRIDTTAQLVSLAAKAPPELVNASNPGLGKEVAGKN